jgi:hypothetical protein
MSLFFLFFSMFETNPFTNNDRRAADDSGDQAGLAAVMKVLNGMNEHNWD